MKRILFLPGDHGGGRGHVTRSFYLAQQLDQMGHRCAIVLEAKHYAKYQQSFIPTFLHKTSRERLVKYQLKKPFKPQVRLETPVKKHPAFVEFSSLSFQVPRDGYLTPRLVRYRMKQLGKIIDGFKPDYLVGDGHFLTYLLGRKFDIPVVQITRKIGYAPGAKFVWWKKPDARIIEPNALEPFEEVLADLGITDVAKAEDLFRGERYLIPAIREIEPVAPGRDDTFYCGPFADPAPPLRAIPFFNVETPDPKIYISVGGGARRGQEEEFFERLVRMFDRSEFRVLISTGHTVAAKKYARRFVNIEVVDWIDGASAIRQSDLIIHHGGYSTTLEAVLFAKPSIVIPSHSEQEGNGRRLERLDIGRVILPVKPPLEPLEFSWPYGRYAMLAGYEIELNQQTIFDAINDLLYDDQRIGKLKKLSRRLVNQKKKFQPEQVFE